MTRPQLSRILPFVLGVTFIALSFSRPPERGLWIGLGVVFLLVGVRRRRAAGPGSNHPNP